MTTILSTIELENVRHGWLWLALAAAGLLLMAAIYRGIYQRSGERLAWWLMMLRVAGLAALVVALARPIWTYVSQLVDPGRVAVVVDDSLSMSLADAGGQPRYALATSTARWSKRSVYRLCRRNLVPSSIRRPSPPRPASGSPRTTPGIFPCRSMPTPSKCSTSKVFCATSTNSSRRDWKTIPTCGSWRSCEGRTLTSSMPRRKATCSPRKG